MSDKLELKIDLLGEELSKIKGDRGDKTYIFATILIVTQIIAYHFKGDKDPSLYLILLFPLVVLFYTYIHKRRKKRDITYDLLIDEEKIFIKKMFSNNYFILEWKDIKLVDIKLFEITFTLYSDEVKRINLEWMSDEVLKQTKDIVRDISDKRDNRLDVTSHSN